MKTSNKRKRSNTKSSATMKITPSVYTKPVVTAIQSAPKTRRTPKDARWAVRSKATDKVLFRGSTRTAIREWRNARGYQEATYLFDEQNNTRIR